MSEHIARIVFFPNYFRRALALSRKWCATTMARDLLVSVVVTQFFLFVVYAVFATRMNLLDLWGRIPPAMHVPGIALAALGYLLLLVAISSLAVRQSLTPPREWGLIAALLFFTMLQVLFVPFASMALRGYVDKNVVRSILMLAVLPVATIVGVAAQEGDRIATVCASVALLHYTAFDALYYGFSF